MKDLQKGYAAMEAYDQKYSEAMEKYRSEYERSLNMPNGGATGVGPITAAEVHSRIANSQIGTGLYNTVTTAAATRTAPTEAGFRVIKIENGWILHDPSDGKRYYCETREAVGNMITTLLTFLEN